MTFNAAQKNEMAAFNGQAGATRRGLVLTYQQQPPMAKVLLQPENIETGWLPVLSPWSANGWGIVIPLAANDQVLLVCEEADGQNYAIWGRYYSDADAAPATLPVAGEFFMQSQGGAQLYFKADGSVVLATTTLKISAPGGGNATVNITGTLQVTGEVYRGFGTGDQVSLGSHTHHQPNDSHGDSEQPTNAPTAGT